uniref:Uncharacterized protein n=1 Tax=Aegilops tauschii subsp. strangulata TaxID=200361 RepID=A0A453DUP2_AEGTS
MQDCRLIDSFIAQHVLTFILLPLWKPGTGEDCRETQEEAQERGLGLWCWLQSWSTHLFAWGPSASLKGDGSMVNDWNIYPAPHVLLSTTVPASSTIY